MPYDYTNRHPDWPAKKEECKWLSPGLYDPAPASMHQAFADDDNEDEMMARLWLAVQRFTRADWSCRSLSFRLAIAASRFG